MMKRAGIPLELFLLPNLGHWYPDGFAERLDHAVAHVWAGERN